ncbi:hypothetical protein E5288_WYG022132 [Bos mutus]|uniref:Uncharacterized protein n=1 Tax=Bos mutus TaxID=72004 RepID=A0A6B0RHT6_9CETA|nr:hypothetical protein [Bos mutus]
MNLLTFFRVPYCSQSPVSDVYFYWKRFPEFFSISWSLPSPIAVMELLILLSIHSPCLLFGNGTPQGLHLCIEHKMVDGLMDKIRIHNNGKEKWIENQKAWALLGAKEAPHTAKVEAPTEQSSKIQKCQRQTGILSGETSVSLQLMHYRERKEAVPHPQTLSHGSQWQSVWLTFSLMARDNHNLFPCKDGSLHSEYLMKP